MARTSTLTIPIAPGEPLDRLPDEAWTRDAAAHLLRRAGFGGPPAEVDRLHARGLKGAVDWLVDYERTRPGFPDFAPSLVEGLGYRKMKGLSEEERRKLFQQHVRRDQIQLADLRTWWLERMVKTARPLEERMTLFWHGHFTSSHRDVQNSYHMFLQNALLRRHAVGDFGALVRAISRDPAMLEYLDNRVNRKKNPNENFARELLELFTMGIGHYTERDIKEVARAYTGWSFEGNEYRYRADWHDGGTKTILGRRGTFDGDDVVDLILGQPATAKHVAGKIFRHFAHDEPSDDVVRDLAKTLARYDYQVKPVLKRLLRSREFYSERAVATQIKSPVVLVASLLRAAEVEPEAFGAILANYTTGKLGMALLDPPNVKGWPGGRSWITTSSLLARYNAAANLMATPKAVRKTIRYVRKQLEKQIEELGGKAAAPRKVRRLKKLAAGDAMIFDPVRATEGCGSAKEIVAALSARFLAVEPSEELRRALEGFLGNDAGKGNRGRLHQTVQLLVSSPEFQLS